MNWNQRVGIMVMVGGLGLSAQGQTAPRAGVVPDKGGKGQSYAEFSYVGPSSLELGSTEFGDIDTSASQVSYQAVIRGSASLSWIAGVELKGTWFDVPSGAPVPDGLYETSLRLGALWRISDDWRLQFMASPGLYSDMKDIDGGDFNATGLVLATWQLRPRLQLIGGLAVNFRNDVPVIPALGARWQFADDWTLLAVYPAPRIEYAIDEDWTVFAGAEIVRSAYRVAEDFGDAYGRPELNGEDLSYNEWRVGLGFRWQATSAVAISIDGGWTGQREFVYDERDFELESDGAPYIQIGVRGTY
ncbi:MAG: hypothetical protein IT581_10205 [Verrucomicrobiales bacterium]|nr:hypothetical protein [Verrucomicrobiales bacterium]